MLPGTVHPSASAQPCGVHVFLSWHAFRSPSRYRTTPTASTLYCATPTISQRHRRRSCSSVAFQIDVELREPQDLQTAMYLARAFETRANAATPAPPTRSVKPSPRQGPTPFHCPPLTPAAQASAQAPTHQAGAGGLDGAATTRTVTKMDPGPFG
jgi:hypothetical protein